MLPRPAAPKRARTAARQGVGIFFSRAALLMVATLMVCAGCGSKPQAPDWQVEAHGALERYTQAYLSGADRAAAAEFTRAREQLARTGNVRLVARAELTRCALQVASLDVQPCMGFEPLRADASAVERAYAAYLEGRATAAELSLLPAQHRAVAASLLAPPAAPAIGLQTQTQTQTQVLIPGRALGEAQAVRAIGDPVARLVAAGVVLRAGRASAALLAGASDDASQHGWRRPLLAWLGAQALRAEQGGATDEAQRLRRRMALVAGER